MALPDHQRVQFLLSDLGWLDSLARGLVREPELAEDAVQETCLTALERGPRHAANLRGWMAAVARNVVRKTRRGEGRRRAREEDWSAGRPSEVSAKDAESRFALRHDLANAVMAGAFVHRIFTWLLPILVGLIPPGRVAAPDPGRRRERPTGPATALTRRRASTGRERMDSPNAEARPDSASMSTTATSRGEPSRR